MKSFGLYKDEIGILKINPCSKLQVIKFKQQESLQGAQRRGNLKTKREYFAALSLCWGLRLTAMTKRKYLGSNLEASYREF